ncbi:hypothetical protein [uncultured Psychroserpens sp.]|uniref:hypothetical protein n=1 Tax=uncultured Psychroserpens sp. TaxID=255436 RepID=UPI0026390DC6|nr:hypothetical protein [uncultured Psychroserpens sp.]
MNDIFKKRETNFLIQLLGLSALIFSIHYYLIFHFAKEVILFFPLWHIYAFHIITVIIIYTLINYRASIGKTEVFNAFILGMLLKMILTIVFLLPWILSKPEQKGVDLANFFIPYFIFLSFEVFSVVKILQK